MATPPVAHLCAPAAEILYHVGDELDRPQEESAADEARQKVDPLRFIARPTIPSVCSSLRISSSDNLKDVNIAFHIKDLAVADNPMTAPFLSKDCSQQHNI
jgi:hypothetical protein